MSWIDAGIPENIFMASEMVRIIQKRQGLGLGFVEEIALEQKLIDIEKFSKLISKRPKSDYNDYLKSILNNKLFTSS